MTMPKKRKQNRANLFGPAEDWWHNACLNYLPDQLNAYATGYKDAGDIVADHAIRHRYGLDTLIYPILFLYRHYLEIRIKEIIQQGNRLLRGKAPAPHGHRLINLWEACSRIITKVWPEEESGESVRSINRCIRELSRVDPTSEAFRYSRLRKGRKSLAGITHINVRHVRDVMAEVSRLLDGASLGISEYRQGPF